MGERRFILFKDPSNGMIDQRVVTRMMEIAHQFTEGDLTELDKDQLRLFDDILLRVGWKLVATWTHLDRYRTTEDRLITAAKQAGPINNQEVQQLEYSQDLFLEIDEFLVQLKSTLDHLANIPFAVFGKSWQPRKFSSKGKNISEALLSNLPKGNEERARGMKEMLIDRYNPWLTEIIDKRDATNHFMGKSFHMDGLMVFRQIVEEEERLHVPMWDEKLSVREVLETSWINLLTFSEDFIAISLSFRIVNQLGMIHNKVDPRGIESPWSVILGDKLDEALSNRKPDQQIIIPQVVLFTSDSQPTMLARSSPHPPAPRK